MSPYDLTTLPALKAWLGLPAAASPNDATLTALISASSRAILGAISRPGILPQKYSETIDGESQRLFPRNWPVLQVATLTADGIAIPLAISNIGGFTSGYVLQTADIAPPGRPQAIDIFDYNVCRGRQNIAVAYTAGYAISAEAQSVLATSPWQVSAIAPYGPWASSQSVVYAASGVALTAVSAAPSIGQYAVSAGVYTFSSADAGAAIILSYGYIPQDLTQAALELSAERFRASERIGLRSKSVGGQETISYDISAMSAGVLALLQPYRRVTL